MKALAWTCLVILSAFGSAQLISEGVSYPTYWAPYSAGTLNEFDSSVIEAQLVTYNPDEMSEMSGKAVLYPYSLSTVFVSTDLIDLENAGAKAVISFSDVTVFSVYYTKMRIPVLGISKPKLLNLTVQLNQRNMSAIIMPQTSSEKLAGIDFEIGLRALFVLSVLVFGISGIFSVYRIVQIYGDEMRTASSFSISVFISQSLRGMTIGRAVLFVIVLVALVRIPLQIMDITGTLSQTPTVIAGYNALFSTGNLLVLFVINSILLVWVHLALVGGNERYYPFIRGFYAFLYGIMIIAEIIHRTVPGSVSRGLWTFYSAYSNLYFGCLIIGYLAFATRSLIDLYHGRKFRSLQNQARDSKFLRFLLLIVSYVAIGICYIVINVFQATPINILLSSRTLFFLESGFCLSALLILYKSHPKRVNVPATSTTPPASRSLGSELSITISR